MSEARTSWPTRGSVAEFLRFAALLLGGFGLAASGAGVLLIFLAYFDGAFVGGHESFTLVGAVAQLTDDGLRFGSVVVPWPLALPVFVALAAASLYAFVRLVRGDGRPALAVAVAQLAVVAPLALAGGASLGEAVWFPETLALVVIGTWPEARRLVRR